MGYSRKEKDFYGNDIIQHYGDNGEKLGHSEVKTDVYGDTYVQHYDNNGKKTGSSRMEKDFLGNTYMQHYDRYGKKTGTSEAKTDFLGGDYVQHYNNFRERTGTSEERTDVFGSRYTRHSGGGGGGSAVGGGSDSGLTTVLIVVGVIAFFVFEAWRCFVSENKTLLKMILEYAVPLLTLLIIAIRCAAEDKRLRGVGFLEGAIAAVTMGVTQYFGLELSGPVGDYFYYQIMAREESSGFYTFLSIVFPFFMFCLIFILFPVMGLLFHWVCAGLEDNLRERMRDFNTTCIRVVCLLTTVLFIVLFATIELEDKGTGLVIAYMLFNGLFAFLAMLLMRKLAKVAAGV